MTYTYADVAVTAGCLNTALTQISPAAAQPEELSWSGESAPPYPSMLALTRDEHASSDTSSISSSDAHSDDADGSSSDASGEESTLHDVANDVANDVFTDVTDDCADLVAAALADSGEGAHSDVDDDVASSSDSDLASVVSDTLAEVTAAAAEQQQAALRTLHKHVSAPSYVRGLCAQLQQSGTALTADSVKAALKQCRDDCKSGAAAADVQLYSLVQYALRQLVKVAKQHSDSSGADVLQEWLASLDAKVQHAAEKLRKVTMML